METPGPVGAGKLSGMMTGPARLQRDPQRAPDQDRDDRDLSPGCARGYRGHPAAAPSSPMAQRRDRHQALDEEDEEEEEEEDGGLEVMGGRRQRQSPRAAPRDEEGGHREATASRRHRPARKRSRGSGTESPGSRGSRGLLAAALARLGQLGTEAAAWLLRSCCRLGWPPGNLQGWGQQLRSSSLRVAQWLRRGSGLLAQLLGILLAFLFLLLMLLLGTLRLCWRWGATGAARVASSHWPRRLLDAAGLRGTWGLLVETLRGWGLPVGGVRMAPAVPGEAPGAGEEEVARLVALAEVAEEELDPFEVLGLEVSASDAELRRAYRRLAVLVHPDKSQHPRAAAAFRVLRAAWDAVSSPERRRDCERKRLARSELRRSVGELLSRLQQELRDAANTMSCSRCRGQHRRFELQRDPLSARYCAQCGGLHPADEGDLWAESRLLGLRVSYLARMGGRIYDITEWAGCQRVAIAPDTHRVPYHLSFGPRGPAPAGRHRSSSKCRPPPSAADLQDFFTRLFQGGGGTAGGPFPSPHAPTPQGAAAAAPAGGPPKPEGAAAKGGDPKHRRRRKVRRPLQR